MAGQLVKQREDLSISTTYWTQIFETLFMVSKSQAVRIEFTLVDTEIRNTSTTEMPGAQLLVKIGLNGPGQNNEADAAQTITYPDQNAPLGLDYTYTRQLFLPASGGTLTLAPGHYLVTVQVRGGTNSSALVLTAAKAYLAISGGG